MSLLRSSDLLKEMRMKKEKLTPDTFRKKAMMRILNMILNWFLILTMPIWLWAAAWISIANEAFHDKGYEREILSGRKSLLS